MSGSNNPTPTITLQSRIADLLKIAVTQKHSKSVARFDFGEGREIVACVFVNDSNGYMNVIQAYENGRDEYAARVANSVAESIEKDGLPPKGTSFNIVKSSGIEEGVTLEDELGSEAKETKDD